MRPGTPRESGGETEEVSAEACGLWFGVEGAWRAAGPLEGRMGSSSSERSGVEVSCMRESPSVERLACDAYVVATWIYLLGGLVTWALRLGRKVRSSFSFVKVERRCDM